MHLTFGNKEITFSSFLVLMREFIKIIATSWERQEGDPPPQERHPCWGISTCSAADPALLENGEKWKGNFPTEGNKASHYALEGGTDDEGEAWALIEGNVFIIHPRFSAVLKILVPLRAEKRGGHLQRKGGMDRWTRRERWSLLCWSLLRRGGHYFLERRGRGTYS